MNRCVVVAAVVLAWSSWSGPAAACGPAFGETLLDDRSATLLGLPDGSFLLEAMRLQPPPSQRYLAVDGEAPPRAVVTASNAEAGRSYDAGVAALARGDNLAAINHFRAVLAMPLSSSRERAAHAAFTLGRIEFGAAGIESVENRWVRVRALVEQGAVDDEGLAVASYGAEAREALAAGRDVDAIRLYATQAAFGSQSGALSLLFVVRAIVEDDARAAKVLADPLGQALVTTFLWTRGIEAGIAPSPWEDPSASAGPKQPLTSPLLQKVLALPGPVAGSDRLAAALYRAGQIDAATKVLEGAPATGLAAWVRARLAVRAGDLAGAERALIAAMEALRPDERWPAWDGEVYAPRVRLIGERATLALADGRFDDAAGLLLEVRQDYWHDFATVAERVLTIEQLQQLVERAPPDAAAPPRCRGEDDDEPHCSWSVPTGTRRDLRALLGRRLMRSGRFDEALPYLEGRDAEAGKAYVQARHDAVTRRGIDKAEALWAAAQVLRQKGMEISGTEVGPDWAEQDGTYDRSGDLWWAANADEGTPPAGVDGMVLRLEQPENAAFVTAAEKAACRRHAPTPTLRFHYRHGAALLAQEAASLVPPRSQAFAALLCTAAKWTPDSDARRGFYRQYVQRGAMVDFAGSFGGTCPPPDFARARIPPPRKPIAVRKRDVAIVLAAVGLVGAGVFAILRRRRR